MLSHISGSRCAAFVFLACSALHVASLQASSFVYPDFSSTSGLNLVPSAVQTGNELRLNPAVNGANGAAWHTTKHPVQAGFETMFNFRVTGMSGENDPTGQPGGDGFAFVVQNTSTSAVGPTSSYMGYEIANSLAVEFDTWQNPNFLALEPSNNHVGVQSRGTAVNTPFAPGFIGAANVVPNMSDTNVHTAMIRYVPGTLDVFVDDMVTPVLSVSVDLGILLSLDSGKAYVGITGGGANAYENHDILNWKFNSVPEPASIALLAVACGGLAVLAPRRACRRAALG